MTEENWPEWWKWELEFSFHLLRRMRHRRFSEVDLRAMLADARACLPDAAPNRWLVKTVLHDRPWEVIVEPDFELQILVVITAYMVKC